MNKEQERNTFFEEVLRSETINIKCNNCGSDQIMNTAYAQHVKNGLLSCSNCRNKSR